MYDYRYIPYSPDLSPLLDGTLTVHGRTLANRVVFQPMEGCDGELDGRPGELTTRRYRRFALAGPGIVWMEAVAVVREGRANPRQLYLNKDTAESFKKLVDEIKTICLRENGFEPLVLAQLTHSGRYSKPEGAPAPMVAYCNPLFEKDRPVPEGCVVTDDYLKALEERFGRAAALAQGAGFDGADVKCCHGYLLPELLSAYSREGPYGGAFENRASLLLNCFEAAKAGTGKGFILTTRLNAYDGFPYPWGFGVSEGGDNTPDLREALTLVAILRDRFALELVNITAGIPYLNPHVNRPADTIENKSIEDPVTGVGRILSIARTVQAGFPDLSVVASGFAYLGGNSFGAGAGLVKEGWVKLAGFGRQAFAYPGFLSDIRSGDGPSPEKCCLTCAKCSELMRAGSAAGCVVRDAEVYAPLYVRHVKGVGK